MDNKGYLHYKEQSINTMTQGELLLLLYDELIKRMMRCDIALKKPDYELFDASVDRCIQIIRYLDDTLDPKYAISRELHRLYDFFGYELNRVKMGRNKKELDNIRPMIVELRDAFRTAEKNSGGEGKVSAG